MKKLIFTFALLLFAESVFGQSIHLFDVDESSYPKISARFYVFDENGESIRNFDTGDFEVTENGESREVLSVSCPPVIEETIPVSVAMSIDISGSMSNSKSGMKPVELGKTTATQLCELIDMPPSEFALQKCHTTAYMVQDYTTSKFLIKNAIKPIRADGGNDFVEQLLNPNTGLLNIAKLGRHAKKAAVIYTDAWFNALSSLELQACIDTCKKYDIEFHAILFSRPEAQPFGIKMSLVQIAQATGGLFLDGVTEEEAALEVASAIQHKIEEHDPCYIEWEAIPECEVTTNHIIRYLPEDLSASTKITVQKPMIANLSIDPFSIDFGSVPVRQ